MPLPMVHFAIATQLAARTQQYPAADFLLGNIAPDAIHMRPGTDRADKRRTHLNEPADTPDHTQLHAFLRQQLASADPHLLFTIGYVAHILADRLWLRTVGMPFWDQFPSDHDHDAIRILYYQETDQLDFNLYNHAPWRSVVWERLALAVAPSYAPLLSAEEITQWQQRTLHWFGELQQAPNIMPQYITDSVVATFVEVAVDLIDDQFTSWGVRRFVGE